MTTMRRLATAIFLAALLTTGSFFWRTPFVSGQSGRTAELTQLDSVDGVDYVLSGLNTSRSMRLTIRNRTSVLWIVHVEVGTKLEPANDDVQEMVVVTEVHVTAHPHQETSVDLDVACLDIDADAPSTQDTRWTVKKPALLAQFIGCANTAVDVYKRRFPQDAQQLEALRPTIMQMALWQARGATRAEMIDFFVKYRYSPSPGAAAERVDAWQQLLAPIHQVCPSLRNL